MTQPAAIKETNKTFQANGKKYHDKITHTSLGIPLLLTVLPRAYSFHGDC